MLSNQTIQCALQDRNISEVARRTNLSIHTVLKMQKGKFDNLRFMPLQTVSDYLESTGVRDDNGSRDNG